MLAFEPAYSMLPPGPVRGASKSQTLGSGIETGVQTVKEWSPRQRDLAGTLISMASHDALMSEPCLTVAAGATLI